jgi:hypothetical protein
VGASEKPEVSIPETTNERSQKALPQGEGSIKVLTIDYL